MPRNPPSPLPRRQPITPREHGNSAPKAAASSRPQPKGGLRAVCNSNQAGLTGGSGQVGPA
ncbi:hypothetical protein [Hymenobacter sp. BT491]|uniref:hypothetical protein n=1 Tax=Hymenobacter sp. BT491 TaxID=2766779 RepID=UPI0016536924|nr:hypothetical protein [Hymenobacter sp. BT491]MBC6992213.1 hypothetical protein [Hymenobacter sp. BT491]